MTHPEFTLHDLKCGNIVNYMTTDGHILPCTINWEHLKWLTEDPTGFNAVHFPMELTEELILKFFSNQDENQDKLNSFKSYLIKVKRGGKYFYGVPQNNLADSAMTLYVHEIQNLFYSFSGEHLTFEIK